MPEKICTLCKFPKDLDNDFNKKKSSHDGKQNVCRECNRNKCNKYYNSNRESHKRITIARKWKVVYAVRQYVYDFLKDTGCIDCPEKDPVVLEFDHVRGEKRDNLSAMIGTGCSLESVKREMEKCVVRCANCHRRKTAKDQNWYCNINIGSITQLVE